MKKTILKRVLLGVFLAVELFIYSLIITDSINTSFLKSPFANDIRFIATFMMALFGFILSFIDNKINILLLAVFFFVGADAYLVLGDTLIYGIISFILAQLTIQYFINRSINMSIIQLVVASIVGCVYFIIRNIIADCEISVVIAALFYGACSIFNIVTLIISIIKNKSFRKNICLLLSLIFLLACDVCLGLGVGLNISIFPNCDWIFYMPTLILLVLEQYILSKE